MLGVTQPVAARRKIPFSPGQAALNCFDRAKHHLSIATHEFFERKDCKLLKHVTSRVGFCVLATKLGTKENVHEVQPLDARPCTTGPKENTS